MLHADSKCFAVWIKGVFLANTCLHEKYRKIQTLLDFAHKETAPFLYLYAERYFKNTSKQ